MATIKIEGKEVTLPDDVVKAGDGAIRAVLAANGFPAVEGAHIEIEGGKGGAPAIVKVSPRAPGKGLTNETLNEIKQFALDALSDRYGYCGLADGEYVALLNSGDAGEHILIKISYGREAA